MSQERIDFISIYLQAKITELNGVFDLGNITYWIEQANGRYEEATTMQTE